MSAFLSALARMSIPEEIKKRHKDMKLSPEMEEMIRISTICEFKELAKTSTIKRLKQFLEKYEMYDIPLYEHNGCCSSRKIPASEVYDNISSKVQKLARQCVE